MKKKLHYIIGLLLLLLTITTTYGQESPADIRRTPEDQAAFEKGVPVNPAKIDPATQVDPKMDPAQAVVSAINWKPAVVTSQDMRSPELNQVESKTTSTQPAPTVNRTQPEGEQPKGKTVNRRDANGSKTQPEGAKPANVTNYRDIKGPKTQPEGEKPKQ